MPHGGQEAGSRREGSGGDHRGPRGITRRGARSGAGLQRGCGRVVVMVVHRGRLLPLGSQDGGASPLRVLSMTHTRTFQRAPGCSWAPLPSTWFLTQDGVRVRAAVGRGPGGQEGGGQAPAELIWLKGAAVWALNWSTRSSSGWDWGVLGSFKLEPVMCFSELQRCMDFWRKSHQVLWSWFGCGAYLWGEAQGGGCEC